MAAPLFAHVSSALRRTGCVMRCVSAFSTAGRVRQGAGVKSVVLSLPTQILRMRNTRHDTSSHICVLGLGTQYKGAMHGSSGIHLSSPSPPLTAFP